MHQHRTVSVLAATDAGLAASLRSTIGAHAEIAGTAADPAGAVAAAVDLVPDVVVLDGSRDPAGAGALCAQLRAAVPASRSVVLAGADDGWAYEILLQGAFSVLPRLADVAIVGAAVYGTARGESTLLAGSAARLLEDGATLGADGTWSPVGPRLTRTEDEVLRRLAAGDTVDAVAAEHFVTARLVRLHTGFAVAKLHRFVDDARARTRTRARLAARGRVGAPERAC